MSAEQNFPLLLRLLYPGLCSAVNSVSALPVFLSSRVKDALKNLGQTFFLLFKKTKKNFYLTQQRLNHLLIGSD